MEPRISLLVPTLGQRKIELTRLLDSLVEQDYKNLEVVVISQDNHHTVDTLCDLYRCFFSIEHIKLNNKGLSLARNNGLSHATGEIIILSDDDCWYPKGSIKFIVKMFESHPTVDILLTQIYDPISDCSYKKYETTPMQLNKRTALLSKSSIEISYRNTQNSILFDEYFGLGARYVAGEENDFLVRCLKAKKRIFYFPQVTVFHEKKKHAETHAQLIAKGALYSKDFGFFISNAVLLRDLIKKRQNNYRWFWHGYYDFKTIERNNKRNH